MLTKKHLQDILSDFLARELGQVISWRWLLSMKTRRPCRAQELAPSCPRGSSWPTSMRPNNSKMLDMIGCLFLEVPMFWRAFKGNQKELVTPCWFRFCCCCFAFFFLGGGGEQGSDSHRQKEPPTWVLQIRGIPSGGLADSCTYLGDTSPLFPGILLSRKTIRTPGETAGLKRTMVEKNGESTPRTYFENPFLD